MLSKEGETGDKFGGLMKKKRPARGGTSFQKGKGRHEKKRRRFLG